MSFPTEPSETPSRQGTELAIGQALMLGALHGPAELLPISSSGHVALIPWLLGWDYDRLDPELRKAFEVALHAGTAAALLITLRLEVQDALQEMSFRLAGLIVLSFVPPAVVGLALEREIEQHLGTPSTTAAGLICGSLVMAWADRAPQARSSQEAGAVDALWLGGAQACALIPGVSRNGATLAAARIRGFTREDANRLSRHVALPVIAGATVLKTVRVGRRGLPPGTALPFAVGAAASFASTLGSTWLIRQVERDRSLLPYAVYRLALAGTVLRRLRRLRRV
jgi:undecaprenyl-diphosphatase